MTRTACDGCDRQIVPAGSIVTLQGLDERRATGGTGLTLELTGGTTHELCYPCIRLLPEEPTEADVAALSERDLEHADRPVEEDPAAPE
ncbi:DUF7561 family protein [Halovivax limisalsi]|uniref:DUF7561 family protein n=1 Tax=Halovivax limisalsi TaxID=1453760 RepID=UPI001FFC5DC1|nr:hypothetical protein [Halovivax limisalsi]